MLASREPITDGGSPVELAPVSRWARAAVLILIVAGCALRISGIDGYAFSPDDALHVAEARLDFPGELLSTLAHEDTHPPGHYLLLRVLLMLGATGGALRIGSLLPSLLLIPLAYGLGRRTAGHASGLFAAFIVTFSAPLIAQAQVIRPYALELSLLAGALWILFDDRPDQNRRRLALYGVLMALAVFTHYSAVIALAAMGGVRLVTLLRARKQRAAVEWAALHFLLAILTLSLIGLFASVLLESGFRRDAVGDWLDVGFPQSRYVAAWLGGTLAQMIYFIDPPRIVPGALLCVLMIAGAVALAERRRVELCTMLGAASVLNLVLAAFSLYPFSGTRHALYLLPFVAPIAGAGFQWAWDEARPKLPNPRFAAAIAFGVATLSMSVYAGRTGAGPGIGIAETPLLAHHYRKTLAYIEANTKPGEILLGDKQLAYYAWYEGSMRDAEHLSDVVGRTKLGSRDFYYYDSAFVISDTVDLARFVDSLENVIGDARSNRLRFASLGWRSGLLFRVASPGLGNHEPHPGDDALRSALARAGTSAFNSGTGAGGGVVFSVDWKTLDIARKAAR
jgi:hypothetical protein